MLKSFSILLVGCASCLGQAFTFEDQAWVGNLTASSLTVAVNFVDTFQGGTNGASIVSTNSLTNSLSLTANWGPGVWCGQTSLNGSVLTNINANTMGRFLYDNTVLPPSPFSTFSVGGTSVPTSAETFCLRYNHITNATTDTSEDIVWQLPYSPTNLVATIDFLTRMDNTTGNSGLFDILELKAATGSSDVIANFRQQAADFIRVEVNSATGTTISLATNHWYRLVLLGTNGGGCLRVLDLENNFAQVGSDSTLAGGTPTGWRQVQFGQVGHSANPDIQARNYSWFANLTVDTNSVFPPVYK